MAFWHAETILMAALAEHNQDQFRFFYQILHKLFLLNDLPQTWESEAFQFLATWAIVMYFPYQLIECPLFCYAPRGHKIS